MITQKITALVARIVFLSLIASTILSSSRSVEASSTSSMVKGGERIVGGEPITIDKAPYIVQLKNLHNRFFCAGTLVSELFVVTAAHCLNGRSRPQNIRVFAGATLIEGGEPGIERKVSSLWLPAEYKKGSPHMDVAVLKLEAPLKRSRKIRAVKMCDAPPPTGKTFRVAGWGRTAWNALTNSNSLQYVEVPTVSRETCIEQHANIATKITDTMICASQPGLKDACNGDSGGPALYEGRLCGVVSWGKSCGQADYPGVYTSIPTVREFIDDCMKK